MRFAFVVNGSASRCVTRESSFRLHKHKVGVLFDILLPARPPADVVHLPGFGVVADAANVTQELQCSR
jgi:hypothetical protein